MLDFFGKVAGFLVSVPMNATAEVLGLFGANNAAKDVKRAADSCEADINDFFNSLPKSTIHVNNLSGERLYIIVTPNSDWMITDAIVGLATLNPSKMVSEIKNFKDLFKFIKQVTSFGSVSAKLYKVSRDFATDPIEAKNVKAIMEKLKKSSIAIDNNIVKAVSTEDIYDGLRYFSPSGIASAICGASTYTLHVFNESVTKCATFNSNCDQSWIVSSGAIKEVLHGTWATEKTGGTQYPFT